jgi:hypothetical protein
VPERLFAVLRATMLTWSLAAVVTAPALAWGALGHRIISRVAAQTLPPSVPVFVRSAEAIAEIAALGAEADRLKGSGASWDADYDHGHFIDIGDDGSVAGTVSVDALPSSREAYDSLLRGAGTDQYKIGYLPYEIIDGFEQVITDFAYWRVDSVGERSGADRRVCTIGRADRSARCDVPARVACCGAAGLRPRSIRRH